MNITRFALARPVTTTMFFVAILLFGLASSRLLPLEMFPGIDIPQVIVEVPYKGSTPAEVERDITNILEESLATMGGIEEMRSSSSQNGAEIDLRMKWGQNVATKSLEAREKVDAVRHLLPRDVERVFIRQFSTADMPVLNLRISSDRELSSAFDLLDKQLKKPLERVQGVSQVTLYGVEQKQIEIRINADKLAASNISVQTLNSRLQQQNFVINAGVLKTQSRVYQVSPKGEFRNLDDINAIVIAQGLTLGDIADVSFSLPERLDGRHLDQNYAVGLDVFKESGANLVDVSKRVMKVIDEAKQNSQFDGIKLFVMEDQAYGVTSSLRDLLAAGLIGALLSFVVLYLFLRDLKMTLVIVSSVPIAICMTLAAMYFLGYSLNILSMMGLLLAVGMLIDNAVVVTESVLQEKQAETTGSNVTQAIKSSAILRGVDKVSLAVLAGTLTTAIVFLPNIFGVKVELTIFLEHVAIAICISLAASLLVAKTLLPLMLSKLNFSAKSKTRSSRLQTRYQKSLDWILAHPRLSGVFAIIILASTALPLSMVSQDQSDGEGNNRLYINYQVEGRHSLTVTEAMITKMETYLYTNKEKFHIDSVYSYFSADRGQSTLILKEDLDVDMKALKKSIREGFPKFAIAKPQFGWGGDNNGVRVSLTGRSTSELIRISQQVVPLLSSIEGLTDVRSELSGAQQEVVIRIDRQMAARLDLKLNEVASSISMALRGTPLRSFRHDPSGELRIEMAYEQQWRLSLERLKQLPVIRIDNRVYTLSSLAKVEILPRFDTIRHYDRQTALSIGANLDELTTEQAQEKITQVMDSVNFPAGYGYSLRGGFQKQDEDEAVMATNMILAIAMIYIVMAALFESLLLPTAIITSILFSITGVFWALLFTGTPMSIMAMIGILILMGIVVNNGIVLVDQINQMSPTLDELSDAISAVCYTRLRPVLMTVGTTVLGLVPLAMGDTQLGGGGPSYSPMAIAIIGGLTFSTVTSLYLVPLCYQALYRMRYNSAVRLGQADKISRKLLPWMNNA
ncbi:efflux RND transporter permease subunit [Shewanella fidelis]|uniref:Efflux RND transporter permease subunit n=1 Tax=Shewanella fidelis TaxID=173509 RepID=A0AAW8NNS4_9GAMM|nr:efflux RND transporter permease subunit [Shewanella fidelis]MDR8523539.1 efflux RND transporter permease subunit [Shewanella fidelis]MDW4810086.1 efflux RND transporter permease subunit [Shewanella fidelis]MDW4814231.1 efflux RND transporter permease subunit [Shewanella fidelis]MDW4822262.1 efflux RND transporter permease subunit [Shewanella fidelis]MDW4826353.1 efflux RND transporter permease subunit [Shewanella fidelis]